LGHQLDCNIENQQTSAEQQEFYLRYCVFALGVCAAYANGLLPPNEHKRLLAFGQEIFTGLPSVQIESFIEEIRQRPPTNAQCAGIFNSVPDPYKPVVVREIVSILYADSKLEESEAAWVNQLISASGTNSDLWQEVSIYFERSIGAEAERIRCLELLGLPREANSDAVKKAYRQQATQYHPDKLMGIPDAIKKLAEQKLQDLNLAYEALTRPPGFGTQLSGLIVQRSINEWQAAQGLAAGEVAICALCSQRNRLPGREAMLMARCGNCYALLLLPDYLLQTPQPERSN
jgi:hypothetical protein